MEVKRERKSNDLTKWSREKQMGGGMKSKKKEQMIDLKKQWPYK